jgi:transposase
VVWCILGGVSDSPLVEQLLERLVRLETALAERDATIVVLTARVAELEAALRKDSRTSSKPPSSDGPGRAVKPPPRSRREVTGRAPGKQPGEPGATLRQTTRPDRVVVHVPDGCDGCGRSLSAASVTSVEARQVFDLPPIRVHVTEHRLQHRRCQCGTVTMATAPAGVGAPAQYGPRVRAVGAYLVGYQHLPYQRACETLRDLLGVTMSPGTLTTIVTRTADRLTGFLTTIRDLIAAAPVAHFDETGLRVAAATAWVHTAATEHLALFTAHPERGHTAFHAAGVLPAFTGTAVHDGFTPYRQYGTAHQLCNAHHLRELAALLDADPTQTWAQDLIRLLNEINDLTRTARTNGAHAIAPRLLHTYRSRYNDVITAGQTRNPAPGGYAARTPPVRLLHRLHTHADDVLRFAHHLGVPFDNNQAERDIRMVKLRQKISGGLRTWTGAHTFTAIRSYLATTRKHGLNALDALTQLHHGKPWLPTTS